MLIATGAETIYLTQCFIIINHLALLSRQGSEDIRKCTTTLVRDEFVPLYTLAPDLQFIAFLLTWQTSYFTWLKRVLLIFPDLINVSSF